MLLYAITNRRFLPGDDSQQQAALIRMAARWVGDGIDYIQIREKDLVPEALQELAAAIVNAVRASGGGTRVLLNGPAQIALDTGCDGVHLPGAATPETADEARKVFHEAQKDPVISVACHGLEEIGRIPGTTMLLFAPVFEKRLSPNQELGQTLPGSGLDALRSVCQVAASIPVIALGGVSRENATECTAAGAAGIAGIRLFLEPFSRSAKPE